MIPSAFAALALALSSAAAVAYRRSKGLVVAVAAWAALGAAVVLEVDHVQLAIGSSVLVALGATVTHATHPDLFDRPAPLPTDLPDPEPTHGAEGRIDLQAVADAARQLANDQGLNL